MRKTLDVDEKTAEKLREIAAAGGISVEQLLATYVPGLQPSVSNGNGGDAGKVLPAFEEWADSFPEDSPPLSDEAISRASIYRDR
jgi:hypothetical protein